MNTTFICVTLALTAVLGLYFEMRYEIFRSVFFNSFPRADLSWNRSALLGVILRLPPRRATTTKESNR
ncbi:hypothetical protein [Paenarthrobacter sp. PH39-S1]|uniref:hypothetical protein n=1 Tax=Paenarthrobacter sp. PH39-S1 TaxID=3046204 RepID=UPI0024BB6569|nr:hypothetical protein [Paenarthrobacter sp. PH39-S1]MDJ0356598.1 hypothetical protein [Paenarthrobacter sp. PH39-S1]